MLLFSYISKQVYEIEPVDITTAYLLEPEVLAPSDMEVVP